MCCLPEASSSAHQVVSDMCSTIAHHDRQLAGHDVLGSAMPLFYASIIFFSQWAVHEVCEHT
jgi:hypothetical protein